MQISFLAADVPLTKTFTLDEGRLTKEPYPFTRDFTSYTARVKDIGELALAVHDHAVEGHCLLKGDLDRPLHDESRAGHTNPTEETSYLCLDLDFEEGFTDIQDFLNACGIPDTNFLFQYSASAGITAPPGNRGHIFVMLDNPTSPALIKLWLTHLNLTVQPLRRQITLTASGHALRWPLDVTTCQNDKLLYIAPPTYYDADIHQVLPDPMGSPAARLFTREDAKPTWSLPKDLKLDPVGIRRDTDALIAELRTAAGLPTTPSRYRACKGDEDYLINPDPAVVTGVKAARGYTYLNLNGGDSWGYYFVDGKPEILKNFKGEPPVSLKKLDPEFFASLQRDKAAKSQPQRATAQEHLVPHVFRDRKSDTYYTLLWDPETEDMHLDKVSSERKLQDFWGGKILVEGAPIPVWDIVFEPTNLERYKPEIQWLNTFRPTEYMFPSKESTATEIPANIKRILLSIVNQDEELCEHFVNWLSCALKYRVKIGTAWLFQGVSGTGKGQCFDRIICPLFGKDYCQNINNSNIGDNFDGFRERKLIMFLDEIKVPENDAAKDSIMSKLKGLITESNTSLRAMRTELRSVTCYDNVIIATNQVNAIPIDESDRRFHLPPRGTQKLGMTTEELDAVADELRDFADYLHAYPSSMNQAREILNTEVRRFAIDQSGNSIEMIFRALRTGNLEFFASELKPLSDVAGSSLEYQAYDRTVRRMMAHANTQGFKISREQLMHIFTYLRGQASTPAAFTKMFQHHGLPFEAKPMKIEGKTYRGIRINLQPYDAEPEELTSPVDLDNPQSKVVDINSKRKMA